MTKQQGDTYRVLSIDGSGIYGLAVALLLRKLYEQKPNFLEAIDLFAGTSSGAANVLLLAKHEDPGRAVREGALERFWREPKLFSNNNPWNAYLSLFGLTPWYDTADEMEVLNRYFGGRTLGDLHHNVLVTTFNWTGSTGEERVFAAPPGQAGTERLAHVAGTHGGGSTWSAADPPAGENLRSWRPKIFTNAHHRTLSKVLAAVLTDKSLAGPGSASVPGAFIDLYQGWLGELRTDERFSGVLQRAPAARMRHLVESFLVDRGREVLALMQAAAGNAPGMAAATARHELSRHHESLTARIAHEADLGIPVAELAYSVMAAPGFRGVRGGLSDGAQYTANPATQAIAEIIRHKHLHGNRSRGEILDQISMLSIGSTAAQPYYWLQNFDFGTIPLGIIPTNPFLGFWCPPTAELSIQAPAEDADIIARQMLGSERYFRLDPAFLDTPVLTAALLARNPLWRRGFEQRIERSIGHANVAVAVKAAVAFMAQAGWQGAR